jgi:hypothetical protein
VVLAEPVLECSERAALEGEEVRAADLATVDDACVFEQLDVFVDRLERESADAS